MKTILTGFVAVALFAVAHAQADLTGKWQGETKNGTPVALDLKATKTTVTGTLTTEGHTYAVVDGEVNDNSFKFTATGPDRTEMFTGELAGDRITIRLNRLPSNPAVLTRAKPSTVDGQWEGETPSGSRIVLDLTATSTTLTGTITRNGEPSPLSNGKVSANTVTFTATLNGETESLSGELDGDQLRVWLDRQGRERAIVMKRVKK